MSRMIIINPGTGSFEPSDPEDAFFNMDVFIAELHLPELEIERTPDNDYDGYVTFKLYTIPEDDDDEPRMIEVDMPCLPLDHVYYHDSENQNIWHFQRLYIDGSSWVWEFAQNIVKRWYYDDESEDK